MTHTKPLPSLPCPGTLGANIAADRYAAAVAARWDAGDVDAFDAPAPENISPAAVRAVPMGGW